jgi:hypothetical protein
MTVCAAFMMLLKSAQSSEPDALCRTVGPTIISTRSKLTEIRNLARDGEHQPP